MSDCPKCGGPPVAEIWFCRCVANPASTVRNRGRKRTSAQSASLDGAQLATPSAAPPFGWIYYWTQTEMRKHFPKVRT